MEPDLVAQDAAARKEVENKLDTTFLLEAGAGSGKTTVLVNRYVNCVLDGAKGDVGRVAAITFTEKAAGELRQRVREEFERLVREAEKTPDEARLSLIRTARDGLDDAPITTIHSFAARLLREFPVEAGIDPAFEQMDALRAGIELDRLWVEWLTLLATVEGSGVALGEASNEVARHSLSRLLQSGVRLTDVRDLAIGQGGVFTERYDIDLERPAPSAPDLAAGVAALAEPAARVARFCGRACTDIENDSGYEGAMKLFDACDVLVADRSRDTDHLAAGLFGLPINENKTAPGGLKRNWKAEGDIDGKQELQTRYKALVAAIFDLRKEYAAHLTGLAVAVAGAFTKWARLKLLELGRLDFADLLGRLRDLLKGDLTGGDLSARAELQERFDFLLVDEFQDTDPLQAEIVFFLCERTATGMRAEQWDEVALKPGKLFVVGDPKQSIYRFRRADIKLYDRVKRLIEGQPNHSGKVAELSRNFRTVPEAVGWVNRTFRSVFDDDDRERQPLYGPVEPERSSIGGPGVTVLRAPAVDDFNRTVGQAREAEAMAVATLLIEMCRPGADRRWHVEDQEGKRPARWNDVALLFRKTTGLEAYEQALREAGVPYLVDGGKSYFGRREVDDALLCLRAIDDPSDGPAVYGALHSTFFGFSDDDLFLFWNDRGRFDPFAGDQPPGHEPVVAALRALADLHGERAGCEPHELVAKLIRLVHASEFLAAAGLGMRQAIANLEKLVEQARAFTAAGGGGLGEFLDWAAEAGDTSGEAESPVDDEGDAVHLFTIHKAKGLERRIVVLIGGSLQSGAGGGGRRKIKPIVDRDDRSVAVKLKVELSGVGPRELVSQAYEDAKKSKDLMEKSESRRLLYVALTRARDRLVIAHFGKLKTKTGEPSAVLLAPAGDALPDVVDFEKQYEDAEKRVLVLPPGEPPAPPERGATADPEAMLVERSGWLAERVALLARAAKPARATSPSGLEHVDEEVRSGGPGAPPGRSRALALGSAVHRIMELCDLADETSVARLAEAVARDLERLDLADEAAFLALACWRAAPVRAAASAAAADPGAVFRELPIGVLIEDDGDRGRDDGIVVSGAIDLLYRDGADWVIVDYKTDRGADDGVLRERYTPQGAAYAVGVEAATGERVREVVFIAARADGLCVSIPVDDSLRDMARKEVGAAASAGRAVRANELADV